MSTLAITVQPRADVTHLRTSIVLEEQRYHFRFYTSAEDDGWCFDITNDDESSVVRGAPLTAGVDLLHPYRHLSVPHGNLWVYSSDGTDPDRTAFAEGRAALFYLESEEEDE